MHISERIQKKACGILRLTLLGIKAKQLCEQLKCRAYCVSVWLVATVSRKAGIEEQITSKSLCFLRNISQKFCSFSFYRWTSIFYAHLNNRNRSKRNCCSKSFNGFFSLPISSLFISLFFSVHNGT